MFSKLKIPFLPNKPATLIKLAVMLFFLALVVGVFRRFIPLFFPFSLLYGQNFIDGILSIFVDFINIVAWVLLIYGVALKITNELRTSPRVSELFTSDKTDLIEGEKEDELLKAYYRQVLSQSNISFTFSLIFSALGFIVIIFSLLRLNPSGNSQDSTTWANLVAGLIIEAVSALIFVQTNNARRTMIDFSEKIRLDRRLNEALEMIETMEDKVIQSKVKATLVLLFSGLNVEKEALKEVLMRIIESKIQEDNDSKSQSTTTNN